MQRTLLLLFFLFALNLTFAQESPLQPEPLKGEEELMAWKNIKPEKLDARSLMILPSNKLLRLTLNEDLGFTKVIIQDLNGNTLMEKPYDPGTDLDISTLKPGNYFIKVIAADRLLQGKFGKRTF